MTLSDIPGYDGLSPERKERVQRSIEDPAYFQGRISTLVEVMDRGHSECRAERISNETILFGEVRSLQLTRARLLGWIAGAAAVAALLVLVVEKILAHYGGA